MSDVVMSFKLQSIRLSPMLKDSLQVYWCVISDEKSKTELMYKKRNPIRIMYIRSAFLLLTYYGHIIREVILSFGNHMIFSYESR